MIVYQFGTEYLPVLYVSLEQNEQTPLETGHDRMQMQRK